MLKRKKEAAPSVITMEVPDQKDMSASSDAMPEAPVDTRDSLEVARLKQQIVELKEVLRQAHKDISYAASLWSNTYMAEAQRRLGRQIERF